MQTSLNLLLLIFLLNFKGLLSRRKVTLKIPSDAVEGTDVKMECDFGTLPKETKYNVTWFKSGKIIFIYDSSKTPNKKESPVPGLKIDVENSNDKYLVITSVKIEHSGAYSCLFSTGTKSVDSSYADSDLEVAEFPLYFKIEKYRLVCGEYLNGQCSFPMENVEVDLHLFINNAATPKKFINYQTKNSLLFTVGSTTLCENLDKDTVFTIVCTAVNKRKVTIKIITRNVTLHPTKKSKKKSTGNKPVSNFALVMFYLLQLIWFF